MNQPPMPRLSVLRLAMFIRSAGRQRPGQAITEFALVVPVMVTVLLFAIYFYEAIQIKLKVQEVARYTAWEFTGYPLHDYDKGGDPSPLFDTAKGEIETDVSKRFQNLKSTDEAGGSKWLAVGWDPPVIDNVLNEEEPKPPSGDIAGKVYEAINIGMKLWSVASFLEGNIALMIMMGIHLAKSKFIFGDNSKFDAPDHWGFNERGFVKVQVSLNYKNLWIPEWFMESNWYKGSGGEVKHFQGTQFTFIERHGLVADSWRLHYGDDVLGPKDTESGQENTAYWKQVDRMAFVWTEIKTGLKIYVGMLRILYAVISLIAFQAPLTVDPLETTVVSKAYKGSASSGQISIEQDNGKVSYDTSPMPPGSEYEKTLEKRGPNFMGCKDAESLGCFHSLSKDNPFVSKSE